MPYDEALAQRIRACLRKRKVSFEEKSMMGGLAFMVDGKMCVGVEKDRLMARLDPDICEKVLRSRDCRPMDFTGRPMKGFVFVTAEGTATPADLGSWMDLALDFNPKAKPSRKRNR